MMAHQGWGGVVDDLLRVFVTQSIVFPSEGCSQRKEKQNYLSNWSKYMAVYMWGPFYWYNVTIAV